MTVMPSSKILEQNLRKDSSNVARLLDELVNMPIFELFFVKKIPLSRRVGYVMGGWISG